MKDKADRTGIHPIPLESDGKTYAADIIFVHGLGGGSHGTWRHGKPGKAGHYFWPEELAKENPDWRIWTVGYDAGITRSGAQGMLISQRAGNIATQLINREFGKRPIIFITHSMGGLVVKSLIIRSLTSGNADWKALAGAVRGIVFCGTPHRGSSIVSAVSVLEKFYASAAAFAWKLPGLLIGSFAGWLFRTQPHVRQMAGNAVELDLLHDDFLEWQRQNGVPVECFAETKRLRRWLPLPLVVERASANAGIRAPHEADADHLELVKPPPPGHPIHNVVYLGTLRFIAEALKPVERPPHFAGTPETFRIIREFLLPWLPNLRSNLPS